VNDIDATTWSAIGITLSVVGLALSLLVWRRRGVAAGTRAVAWSLLPAAAGLTGTLRLLWRIGNLVVDWAVRLVFSPVVWIGVVVAVVALVLFVVSAAMRAAGVGGRRRSAEALPEQRGASAAGTSTAGTATVGAPTAGTPARRSSRRAEPAVQDKDMDDIEAILRKHGIS
jgi:hypothetical protein